MMEFYKGRGVPAQREALLAVLDDVFFWDDEPQTQRDFLTLLPKLYKEEYDPAYNNLIVTEDGAIKAAVGLYPSTVTAAGRTLKVGGIGNVAVAKDARGKGYMIDLMQMAVAQMQADGTDYSVLGGHRQRYGYFGYEPGGVSRSYRIDRRNLAHLRGKDYQTDLTAQEVTAQDADALAGIALLYAQQPFYAERSPEALYDILCSWRSVPYVARRGDAFIGYFVLQKFGGIQELRAVDPADLLDVLLCAMNTAGAEDVSLSVPPFDRAATDVMAQSCGGSSVEHVDMLNIFNFRNFIDAFLALKATHAPLCDGSVVLRIHGLRCEERLRITVQQNRVTVEKTDDAPDAVLEHAAAVRLITSPTDAGKESLPACAQSWFPVDFYAYAQDNV